MATVLTERAIEKAVCAYANASGFMVKKMQTGIGGAAGWPDRMFIKNGRVFFIEFKRPGGKLSSMQGVVAHLLQKEKIHVYIIDDIAAGKRAIDQELELCE